MINHLAYLFEAFACQRYLAPIVRSANAGDESGLDRLAKDAVLRRDVRDFLDALGVFWDDDDEWRLLPPGHRLAALLVDYCTPLPQGSGFGIRSGGFPSYHVLFSALELTGWTQGQIALITHGRSLCTLLDPDSVQKLESGRWETGDFDPACAIPLGRLSLPDIATLNRDLLRNTADASVLASRLQSAGKYKVSEAKLLDYVKEGSAFYLDAFASAIQTGREILVAPVS